MNIMPFDHFITKICCPVHDYDQPNRNKLLWEQKHQNAKF